MKIMQECGQKWYRPSGWRRPWFRKTGYRLITKIHMDQLALLQPPVTSISGRIVESEYVVTGFAFGPIMVIWK